MKYLITLSCFVLLFGICVLGQNNPNAEKLLRKGLSLTRKKAFTEAVDTFTKAIEIQPNNSESYFLRGEAYMGLKQYQNAINDYGKSLEFSPGHLMSMLGKGKALKGSKKVLLAEETYSSGINICEQYLSELESLNTEENSMKMFTILSQKSSVIARKKDFFYGRATCFMLQKKYQDAIKDATWLIKSDVRTGKVYFLRGSAYYRIGDLKLAKKDLKKANKSGIEKAGKLLAKLE